jgi:hypothetical protein
VADQTARVGGREVVNFWEGTLNVLSIEAPDTNVGLGETTSDEQVVIGKVHAIDAVDVLVKP